MNASLQGQPAPIRRLLLAAAAALVPLLASAQPAPAMQGTSPGDVFRNRSGGIKRGEE